MSRHSEDSPGTLLFLSRAASEGPSPRGPAGRSGGLTQGRTRSVKAKDKRSRARLEGLGSRRGKPRRKLSFKNNPSAAPERSALFLATHADSAQRLPLFLSGSPVLEASQQSPRRPTTGTKSRQGSAREPVLQGLTSHTCFPKLTLRTKETPFSL